MIGWLSNPLFVDKAWDPPALTPVFACTQAVRESIFPSLETEKPRLNDRARLF